MISPPPISAHTNRSATRTVVAAGAATHRAPVAAIDDDLALRPMRNRSGGALTRLVLALYAIVAIAWLWPHADPATSVPYLLLSWAAFMLRTFLVPIGFVAALILIVALRNRRTILSLALGMLLIPTIAPELRHILPRAAPPVLRGETLTLMTVNLWEYNPRPDAMAASILAADADVVLIQEFTPAWQRVLFETLADRYPHRAWTQRCDAFGMAIFSKRPFVEPVRSDFTPGSHDIPQMRAVVEINGRRVVIYNVHLAPPRQLSFFATQNRQFAALRTLFSQEHGPLVVAGDWNFGDLSDHVFRIKSDGFSDAWAQAGNWRGATWPGDCNWFRALAGVRIDHVFLKGGPACDAARTLDACGSDHLPTIVRIGFPADRSMSAQADASR